MTKQRLASRHDFDITLTGVEALIRDLPPARHLLKRVLLAKPWLLVVLVPIYGYKGIVVEDLRSLTGLSAEVIKRALWWLKKFGIVEEKEGRYYVRAEYYRVLDELMLSYCKTGDFHLVFLEGFYIVVHVKGPREISHWSVKEEQYLKLLEAEKFAGTRLGTQDLAGALQIPFSTASKLLKLRELITTCRELPKHATNHGES